MVYNGAMMFQCGKLAEINIGNCVSGTGSHV